MTTALRTAIHRLCLSALVASVPVSPACSQNKAPADADLGRNQTTDGFDYAIDRVAFEVTKSLEDRPGFVIWLLDASGSAQPRCSKTIARVRQLYAGKRDHQLHSAVASFGKEVRLPMTTPVTDFASLKQVADQLKTDNSGVEDVFTAVLSCLENWKRFRAANQQLAVSIVIVTDERGDDSHRINEAIAACRGAGTRVYCIGNAAPFASQKGRVHFAYADGFAEWISVDQGPETAFVEVLNLPIWPPADDQKQTVLSSGFGPWGLSRLCAETGGRFFIADDTADTKFTRDVMSDYEPAYQSTDSLFKARTSGRVRSALFSAMHASGYTLSDLPKTTFRADEQATLLAEIARAQTRATILNSKLADSELKLRNTLVARTQLNNKRLTASFDLTLGRILAFRVRLASLNVELDRMKTSVREFTSGRSNTWTITATESPLPAAASDEKADLAISLLQRVADEHPDTPFAHIATLELQRGFAWKWEEAHRVYKGPPEKVLGPLLIQQVDPKTGKRLVVKPKRPGL